MSIRTWNNLILETRIEAGYAARRNRGSYSGTKIHRLISEYIVGQVDESIVPMPGSLEARHVMNRSAVLFSCSPACGCTQGQNAGKPSKTLTLENVTCTRC